MYIIKNAFRNMMRNKGKNILIGIIITVITLCTCIGLAIHTAGDNLISVYKNTNPLAVSFSLDMATLRNADNEEKLAFQGLTVDDVKKYGDSSLIKDYFYTLETSINSNDIEAADDNERPQNEQEAEGRPKNERNNENKMQAIGDFRITAYSNFAYLADFSNGDKKITDGSMISTDDADTREIVISQSLADSNDLTIGDEISFYLPEDEASTFTFTIVGIYETTTDSSSSAFMGMSALNSSNQIYASISSVSNILENVSSNDSKLVATNGLSAQYYLNANDDVDKFEAEVRDKGLSNYYTVSTNEAELLQSLQPIQNISKFSLQFLLVILVIGIVVLIIISLLNIRDRKYEIGVLRAIGMSKIKVSSQLLLELFFVAMISLTIGTSFGSLLAQPVTNRILASEIDSYTTSVTDTQNNFGGEGFQKPSQTMDTPGDKRGKPQHGQITDYVDSLTVKINMVTILQLVAISILLTISSGSVACLFVNKYNPNKILQERV